jgi:23S rRNA (guanosine2251-2'-O)-methyltransferase
MGSEEWVYGLNPVLEAVRAGRNVRAVYVSYARRERIWDIRKEAERRGIPVEGVAPGFFDDKFPKGHQGIAARVLRRSYVSLEDLLQVPNNRNEIPLFVILDSVEDPRNFGAILRSVDAAGAHGVVIQSHRSASLGPEVSKSSAGAIEHVPVSMVSNIKHAIRKMRDAGIIIIGAEVAGRSPVWEIDLSVPIALVVGSEGKGMRKTVGEKCDAIVSLPMRGRVNSLNVSVATGIILFEALRQRYMKGK